MTKLDIFIANQPSHNCLLKEIVGKAKLAACTTAKVSMAGTLMFGALASGTLAAKFMVGGDLNSKYSNLDNVYALNDIAGDDEFRVPSLQEIEEEIKSKATALISVNERISELEHDLGLAKRRYSP